MNKKNTLLIVIMGIVLVAAVGLTVYIVKQQQDVRSHADTGTGTAGTGAGTAGTAGLNAAPTATVEPTVTTTPPVAASPSPTGSAQLASTAGTGGACTLPAKVTGAAITYPYCPGGAGCTADFTKANCSWTAVSGATSYTVKIFKIDTNTGATTPVTTDTVTSGTNDVFSVTQDNTYECDISATNACGAGVAGQVTALCAASSTLVTPTVTPLITTAPLASAAATAIPVQPTSPPANPTLPETGGSSVSMMILGVGGVAITIIGGLLLLF